MIFDQIDQLAKYKHIPYIEEVVSFLGRKDLMDLDRPEIPILGEKLFVRVMRTAPKLSSENKYETHRGHADVQVVLKGVELMQIARPQDLVPSGEYDPKGDYQFYNCEQSACDVVVRPKQFVVFMPGEPHKPGCQWRDITEEIYKLVFKVKIK